MHVYHDDKSFYCSYIRLHYIHSTMLVYLQCHKLKMSIGVMKHKSKVKVTTITNSLRNWIIKLISHNIQKFEHDPYIICIHL